MHLISWHTNHFRAGKTICAVPRTSWVEARSLFIISTTSLFSLHAAMTSPVLYVYVHCSISNAGPSVCTPAVPFPKEKEMRRVQKRRRDPAELISTNPATAAAQQQVGTSISHRPVHWSQQQHLISPHCNFLVRSLPNSINLSIPLRTEKKNLSFWFIFNGVSARWACCSNLVYKTICEPLCSATSPWRCCSVSKVVQNAEGHAGSSLKPYPKRQQEFWTNPFPKHEHLLQNQFLSTGRRAKRKQGKTFQTQAIPERIRVQSVGKYIKMPHFIKTVQKIKPSKSHPCTALSQSLRVRDESLRDNLSEQVYQLL